MLLESGAQRGWRFESPSKVSCLVSPPPTGTRWICFCVEFSVSRTRSATKATWLPSGESWGSETRVIRASAKKSKACLPAAPPAEAG